MKKNKTPFLVLLSCVMLQSGIVGALINCNNIFYTPIAQQLSFTNSQLSLNTTIRIVSMALGMYIGPKLYKAVGFKRLVCLCIILSAVLFGLQSRLSAIWQWYLLAPFLGLFSGGCITVPSTIAINNWFKEKKGLALGIALASAGIAGAIFSPLCSRMILSFGWRKAIIVLAVISFVVSFPACLLFLKLKPENGEQAYGSQQQDHSVTKAHNNADIKGLLLFGLASMLVINCVIQLNYQFALLANQLGLSVSITALLTSSSMLGNTAGKVVIGYSADRFGIWKTILAGFMLMGLAALLFVSGKGSIMVICAFFLGGAYAMTAMVPGLLGRMSGKDYDKRSSFLASWGTLIGAVLGVVIGYASDLLGSYWSIYIAIGIMCLLMIPLCILMKKESSKVKKNYKAIIFDLDGVICFTDKYHYQAWKKLADQYNIYFDEEINNRLRGVSRRQSLEIILERYEGQPLSEQEKEQMCTYKNEIYRQYLAEMSPADLSEEVSTTLKDLRNMGIKLAIGSSSKNTQFILEKISLKGFFDAVSDGNNITHSKPDPEVFLKAAQFVGEKPEDCLVIEDATAGIDAACAGGFDSCGLLEAAKYEKTTYPLDSFSQIKEVVINAAE